jgi:hypothetical protein
MTLTYPAFMQALVFPSHPADYRREVANPLQLYRVKQDDEIPNFGNRDYLSGGMPAVMRLSTYKTIKLTKAIQEFWYELNRSTDYTADIALWRGLTDKAWSNERKLRDHADHITGERLDQPDPSYARLMCARNVVSGVETTAQGIDLPTGTPVLRVDALDPDNLPWAISRAGNEHLLHIATTITNVLAPNGLQIVNPFPGRDGRDGQLILYPLLARPSDPMYYPLSRLVKLPIGTAIPPIYNPA